LRSSSPYFEHQLADFGSGLVQSLPEPKRLFRAELYIAGETVVSVKA